MQGMNYTIAAYVIGIGLLWGYVLKMLVIACRGRDASFVMQDGEQARGGDETVNHWLPPSRHGSGVHITRRESQSADAPPSAAAGHARGSTPPGPRRP